MYVYTLRFRREGETVALVVDRRLSQEMKLVVGSIFAERLNYLDSMMGVMDRCGSLLGLLFALWDALCLLRKNVEFRRCAESGMMFPSKTGGEASVASIIDIEGQVE